MREASLKDEDNKFPHLYYYIIAFFWGLGGHNIYTNVKENNCIYPIF